MPKRYSYRVWSKADEVELFQRIERGDDYNAIAAVFRRDPKAIKEKARSMGWGHRQMAEGLAVAPAGVSLTRQIRSDGVATVYAPVGTVSETDDEFLDRVLAATDAEVKHKKQERYATVRILSDVPVKLSLSSDWHLSSTSATHVRGLLDYATAIAKAKNTYALAVGDMTDNPIKWKPTKVADVPDDLRLLDIVLQRFKGKLLGMTSGNHDDWTGQMVGIDSLQGMAERHQLHYAPDELVWLVEIASPKKPEKVTARWVVATRHQYYRHSNLNYTHGCWRWLEDAANNWPNDKKGHTLLPDVLAIGHNHVAAVEHRTYDRGTVIACRMGSWQYTSRHTRQGGWTLMPPTAPTVILPNIRDGVQQPHAYDRWEDALKQ